MSVIYGIVMFNDQPVKQEVLENMKKAMEFTNPDKEALWVNGNAALGSLIKFVSPESFKEVQPIFFEDNQKVMVVSARIDNRDDLCAVFHIPLIHRDNYPDSHYVRLAFEKWGEECCDHLLGDWSFAVYDKTSKKMYVARDHCGIMACYYYSCAEFFAFSSSPKGLLALKEIPKEINELRLAQILVAWPGDGEQTCYQNIYNLLPGHYLTIENKKVQKHKYWELTEQPDLILPNEQDYYDRFLEIFTEAVKCRLRTSKQVGISLSGGLDSTSIAAIAALELAKQNKELFAFTSVPLYKDYRVPKGRNGDEGELAGLMAKMYPNIRHFLVNAEGYDPIECIKKAVDIFDEPMHAAANQYWIQAINDKATEFDVNVLLTGQAGNCVISWPTTKIKLYFLKDLRYYLHRINSLSEVLFDFFFNKELFKYPFLKYSEIDIELVQKVNLLSKMQNEGYDPRFLKRYSYKKSQLILCLKAINLAFPLHFKKSIWYGNNSLDPTGDKTLIEFSNKLPLSLYKINGFAKILVQKGIKQLLPNLIIENTKKGKQAADLNKRIFFNSLQKEEYINDSMVKKKYLRLKYEFSLKNLSVNYFNIHNNI